MIHILEVVMHTLESVMHILESAIHILESVLHILGIYLYGLVASVIKKSGMLATKQNIIIGWGVPAATFLLTIDCISESKIISSHQRRWWEGLLLKPHQRIG